jgi:hypothetical protein
MRGLILKLFVVNFVTLCFYFHCYYQRQGRYLTVDAVVFFVAPLNIVVRYSVAALGIICYACSCLIYSVFTNDHREYRQKAREHCTRGLATLLGRKRRLDSHGHLSLRDNPVNHSKTEKIASRIGPVIPALGFIVQCCGAIYLYHRRKQWHGVATIDQQIFEHACGGLMIGLLSAGYTLRLPFFNEPVPDARITYLEKFVNLLSEQGEDQVLGGKPAAIILHILKNTLIAFCVQLVLLNTKVFEMCGDTLRGAGPFAFFLTLVGGTVGLVSAVFEAWNCDTLFQRLLLPIALPLVVSITFAVVFLFICIPFPVAFKWHVMSYYKLLEENAQLQNVPLDQPCPLLQMDPKAEYIWWLA